MFTNRNHGGLATVIGHDLFKAFIGVLVSLSIALGVQPLLVAG